MPASRRIEGHPYSAVLIDHGTGTEDPEDPSWAYGVIQPPFSRGEELIGYHIPPDVEVREHATTATRTVLSIGVDPSTNRKAGDDHKARIDLAYQTLADIVGELNEIENRTGDFQEE